MNSLTPEGKGPRRDAPLRPSDVGRTESGSNALPASDQQLLSSLYSQSGATPGHSSVTLQIRNQWVRVSYAEPLGWTRKAFDSDVVLNDPQVVYSQDGPLEVSEEVLRMVISWHQSPASEGQGRFLVEFWNVDLRDLIRTLRKETLEMSPDYEPDISVEGSRFQDGQHAFVIAITSELADGRKIARCSFQLQLEDKGSFGTDLVLVGDAVTPKQLISTHGSFLRSLHVHAFTRPIDHSPN